MDLWYFFGALALDIVKPRLGLIGFIAPSNWITNSGAQRFRDKVLADGKIVEFIDFGDFKVFDQAGIQTMIYVMKRENASEYNFNYSKVIDSKINHEAAKTFLAKVNEPQFIYYSAHISRIESQNKPLNFNNKLIGDLLSKIKSKGATTLTDDEVAQGIVAPQDYSNKQAVALLGGNISLGDGIFNLTNLEYKRLGLSQTEKQLVKPFYTTEQLHRYYANSQNSTWVIYTDSRFKNPDEMKPYPAIKQHLDIFQPVITSHNKPYGLHRARDERFFKGEKIISLRKLISPRLPLLILTPTFRKLILLSKQNVSICDFNGSAYSKVVEFWLRYKGKMQGDIFQIDKAPLVEIPIVLPDDQSVLAKLTNVMIKHLGELSDF
jgi:hypothetical protein